MKLIVNRPAAMLVLCLGLGNALAAPAGPLTLPADFPLGSAGLAQTVVSKTVAPGITHYTVHRGKPGKAEAWFLIGDVAGNEAATAKLQTCFASLGMRERITAFHIPGAQDKPYRMVSGGRFDSRAAATAAAKAAAANDCRLYARHSSEDASNRSGPWSIDIVAIAPGSPRGQLSAVVADQDGGPRRPTSELSRTARAAGGINGGFFVENDRDGFPGQPAGISIVAGQLNGAPVTRRPAVVFPERHGAPAAIVRQVDWDAYLEWSDGTRVRVDGINRRVGLVRNCGRTAQDAPVHDHTCAYADDLVYFPPGSRFAHEAQDQARFAIGGSGAVRQLMPGELPGRPDGMLAGAPGGERIAQVGALAARRLAAAFKVDSSLLATYGERLSVINAGPSLVAGGDYVREDAQEGWSIDAIDNAAHKLLMHDWINRRNPRTAIGVRADGVTLLVTVDGHRHGASVGLTVEELRQLLKSLGARDAVNLDGGGSTAMVVGNRLINHPSDAAGERKVGDAIVFGAAR